MPTFEFDVPKGVRPNPDDIPTRVSVGGKEYDVVEGCIEAPIGVEAALKAHGFSMRRRPRVEIRERPVTHEPEILRGSGTDVDEATVERLEEPQPVQPAPRPLRKR